ncbi:Clavaminate synthase-like protein [Mycena crocata]|nr:Clavaminate synthase-like protein [Mycena crocata]
MSRFLFWRSKARIEQRSRVSCRMNLPLEGSHILKIQVRGFFSMDKVLTLLVGKEAVAAALLPLLHEELNHISESACIYRPMEMEFRVTCDTCLTSVFACFWLCRNCGRESCADCRQKLHSLTVETKADSVERTQLLKALAKNRDFCNCVGGQSHNPQDFIPTTRFQKAELEEAMQKCSRLLKGQVPSPAPFLPSSHDSTIPLHHIRTFKDSDLTETIFSSFWAIGHPLLVTGVGDKLKIDWSPHYFANKYGQDTCELVECQTSETSEIKVKDFFDDFGRYGGRKKCGKVKDWPPSEDFRSKFPELYDDFSRAVPVPNYVRRDGVLNIASHFPSNAKYPDLGPKMYIAHANLEASGNQGSTRLHMDMADAVNIMTYAAPDPNGLEGCAAWDIFRAEDSDNIKDFIRLTFGMEEGQDPLYHKCSVKSYRIYQRSGEAVFIPAGCAHQVRNLSDCIKVAIDFVSLENIARCETLTREFREDNDGKAWKEDVLQLRTMMWFAWLSSCRF